MILFDVKNDPYIDDGKETNHKDPKFQAGGHVRISNWKNIFAKGYTQNWSEEVFLTKKLPIMFHGQCLMFHV